MVAKLDRLSRDPEFLAAPGKGAMPFVAADLPDANTLTMGNDDLDGAARA